MRRSPIANSTRRRTAPGSWSSGRRCTPARCSGWSSSTCTCNRHAWHRRSPDRGSRTIRPHCRMGFGSWYRMQWARCSAANSGRALRSSSCRSRFLHRCRTNRMSRKLGTTRRRSISTYSSPGRTGLSGPRAEQQQSRTGSSRNCRGHSTQALPWWNSDYRRRTRFQRQHSSNCGCSRFRRPSWSCSCFLPARICSSRTRSSGLRNTRTRHTLADRVWWS